MKQTISVIALLAAMPAFAEETRHLDAHEHGVGTLNIAMEGATVSMEFRAPGADIVGFEYAATSADDLAKIDAALAQLRAPLDLFVVPAAADCSVTEAHAELVSEESHDDHADEAHDDHDHDDHADEAHDDHDHDDHADEAHDDHDHDDHADEKHDDHDHEEDDEASGHTEFEAHFTLTCTSPDAFTGLTFAYFETFPNAKDVDVQIISASGAQAYDVEKTAPILDFGR